MAYKNWIQVNQPFQNVEEELKAFWAYGNRYRFLLEPPDDDPFSDFARRFLAWEVSTAYPLVIYLFEESNLSSAELLECFKTLESFVVRRMICKRDTKEYNKYFIEIVSRLRNDGPSHVALKSVLAEGSGSTREWPDDEEFKRYFCFSPVYNSLQSSRIGTIFKLLQDELYTKKTEKVIISSMSIEHVMPQEWADHYPLDGEFVPKEMAKDWFYSTDEGNAAKWEQIKEKVQSRNRLIHCFGNLTIVTQPLNAAMKNAAFIDKKEELRNSVLILNRYFDNLEHWDEKGIEKRSISLFEKARKIWTGP